MTKFYPVKTTTLHKVIKTANVRPTCKRVFIQALTEAGVFQDETIGSLELGMLLGKLTSNGQIPEEPGVAVIIDDIRNLDKLPIIE